jgi:hypothetical protein
MVGGVDWQGWGGVEPPKHAGRHGRDRRGGTRTDPSRPDGPTSFPPPSLLPTPQLVHDDVEYRTPLARRRDGRLTWEAGVTL